MKMSKLNLESRAEGSQSIGRALSLIAIVAGLGEERARLSDIAERCKLHVATTRRILQALVSDGFLAFDSRSKVYSIGPAIFSYAVMGNPWFARREIFMPILDRIAERTRDTVLFSIRSGSESVCLARREGDYPIRVMSLEAGSRRPLGAGSGSLAILAFLPENERAAVTEQNAINFLDFKLSAASVRDMIADARRRGFAFNPGRIIDGVYGLAVPLLLHGQAFASISVTAIAARMTPARRRDVLKIICQEISTIEDVETPSIISASTLPGRRTSRR